MDPRDSVPPSRAASSVSSLAYDDRQQLTVIGFGSLLSERSSRLTFPDLQNFRLVRVPDYRRVCAHPASIFFQRGLANLETKEFSSLSVEAAPGYSFVAAAFEVATDDMLEDGVPSMAFLEREEEFDIVPVSYVDLEAQDDESSAEQQGICCTRSTDEAYIHRWGEERFHDHFTKYGVDTIWNWSKDSGLRPCAVYLRHCYLAAKSMGDECFDSFLDETFLVDRKTTVREYIEQNPQVLTTLPPPELAERYSG